MNPSITFYPEMSQKLIYPSQILKTNQYMKTLQAKVPDKLDFPLTMLRKALIGEYKDSETPLKENEYQKKLNVNVRPSGLSVGQKPDIETLKAKREMDVYVRPCGLPVGKKPDIGTLKTKTE